MAGSSRLIDRVRGASQRYRTGATSDAAEFEKAKKSLHAELIGGLDFEQVSKTPRDELARRLRNTLTERVESRALPLNRLERERLRALRVAMTTNIITRALNMSSVMYMRCSISLSGL